jgi:hypothetical protein
LSKKAPARRASVFADNREKCLKTCAEHRIWGIFSNSEAIRSNQESGRGKAGAVGQKKKRTGEVRFFFQMLPAALAVGYPASVVSHDLRTVNQPQAPT